MNCKEEFLEETKGKKILCVSLRIGDDYSNNRSYYKLRRDYTKEEYEYFLASIDFQYDAGYGTQELFGHIWYTDGTWSERGGYDGSEWWEYKSCPKIPKNLLRGTSNAHVDD